MPRLSINVGILDRAMRISAGMLAITLAASGSIGYWSYVGAMVLLTGVVGNCLVYSLLGFSTCPRPAH